MMIVSGGQTGVDRAAWDAALSAGLPQGGWVPKGRLAEDGKIPEKYSCRETNSTDYTVRTERNVVESDATLIVGFGPPQGGTLLTIELCRKHRRFHLFMDLDEVDERKAIQKAVEFVTSHRPNTLNVAGPRGSFREDVYERALHFLTRVFQVDVGGSSKSTTRYEKVEHTADIGIRVYGGSLEELFANAAWGLFDLITDAEQIGTRIERKIVVEAANREELLVRWLSELLYIYDTERFLYARFHVDELTEHRLSARCEGELFDPHRHKIRYEIKAVTYHNVSIGHTNGTWQVTLILDI